MIVHMNSSLTDVHQCIRKICQQCGRDPEAITLIGASKHQSIEKIHELARLGLQDFGENYVQELLEKQKTLQERDPQHASRIRWHFIGVLQRRKVKQIIDKVDWIHSLDRLEVAHEIERRAALRDINCQVLIQINLGDEASKSGLAPDDLMEFMSALKPFSHIHIGGLMTMPPYFENCEEVRPFFKQLRELRDAINKLAVYKKPLRELSMGMSHDYTVAIEEGATMVRIGTALFGERT